MKLTSYLLLAFAAALVLASPVRKVQTQVKTIHATSELPPAMVLTFTDSAADPDRQSWEEPERSKSSGRSMAADPDVTVKPGATIKGEMSIRKNGGTGEIIPNSDFTFKLEPGSFKGGHEHSIAPRPLGAVTPNSSNTGASGVVPVSYTAPAVAGQVLVNGSCKSGDDSPCTWRTYNFNVKVSGLVELAGGGLVSNYLLIGDKNIHPRNHFGTPATVQALARLADEYAATYKGEKLQYNDTSLAWGGLFDVGEDRANKEWKTPHAEHKTGLDTDLRSRDVIGAEKRLTLLQLANKLGFGVLIHGVVKGDPPHWHLRYRHGADCEIYKRGKCDLSAPLPGLSEDHFASQAAAAPLLRATVQVSQDATTGLFTYSYTFTNDSASTSEVNAIQLLINRSVVLDVKTPQGWTSHMWLDGAAVAFAATDVGALPPGYVDDGQLVPSPFQIKPGQSLAGFSFRSPDPPASVELLAQGFQPLPLVDENIDTGTGGLAENSFKGTVQGPVGATNVSNRIDDTMFFVRQHYQDFLSRDPDVSGFQFWAGEITGCATNQQCREVKRINVSAAFFLSIEFQETGYFVYRTYKSAFGSLPGAPIPLRREELMPDTRLIGRDVVVGVGDWQQRLNANKNAYAREFVASTRFTSAFPLNMTATQFVDKLDQNAGGVLSAAERASLISQLTNPADAQQRASVLRKVAEDGDLAMREFNKAFVLMQYFGYLTRNPNDAPDSDFTGYNFWLSKLEQFKGNYIAAEMVKAFISSDEYRKRFGQ